MKKQTLTLLTLLLLTSCASMKESLLTGVSIGAVTGGALGNAHETGRQRDKSTRNGAAIGALLGAGLSYLIHKSENKKELMEQKKQIKSASDIPLITRPKIKRIWVEDQVSGKRFVKGHWEYVIEEQSQWSQP